MNLAIDIGNTTIKAGKFQGARLVKQLICKPDDFNKLNMLTDKKSAGNGYAIVSAVRDYPAGLIAWLKKRYKLVFLKGGTPLPFKSEYKTPQTLGPDRIAGIAAAHHLYAGKNSLVINAGTCITIDFISGKGVYKGGSISPGVEMRFKALHTFTARLPLITPDKTFGDLKGKTTRESILSGVQRGVIEELNGIVEAYSARYKEMQVIVTGGWHEWLKKQMRRKIISEPFLTLQGLNVILTFCLSQEK